ncbi:ABC transporter permease subunit [Spirillospora sp. NPDC050679]
MTAVLASEWLKLRSVRSTHWTAAAVAGFTLLCCAWSFMVADIYDGRAAAERAAMRAAPAEHPLTLALPLCAALLGVLAVTAEHATGMIRTSLAAVPDRSTLLAAKAGAVAAAALAVSVPSVGAAFLLGRLIVGDRAIPEFQTPVADELPWLAALCLQAVVLALVGLGLGAVTRSTAGAVTAVSVLLFVLPVAAETLPPAPWNERLSAVLPAGLPAAIGGRAEPALLPPAAAVAVLAAYAVVALAAGAAVLARRDV